MIKELEIIGFQSHMHTLMKLSPGVNIIIGNSDEGKSAIIRALRWLFQNRPMGDAFKNWNLKAKDKVSVSVEFEEGEWISRTKNKTTNIYSVSTVEDDLKAIKHDVPQEVFDISKVNEINLQRQQSWFLLDEKSSFISKKFNKLAKLDVMDRSIQIVNRKVRRANTQIKVYDSQMEEAEENKRKLNKWFLLALKDFSILEKRNEKLGEMFDEESKLVTVYNKIVTITTNLEKLKYIKEAKLDFEKLEKIKIDIKHKQESARTANKLTQKLFKLHKNKKAYQHIDKIKKSLKQLLIKRDKFNALANHYTEINKVSIKLEKLKSQIKTINDFIDKNKKIYNQKLKELGKCPTCGRKIK